MSLWPNRKKENKMSEDPVVIPQTETQRLIAQFLHLLGLIKVHSGDFTNPPKGTIILFQDESDNKIKYKDYTGAIYELGSGGGGGGMIDITYADLRLLYDGGTMVAGTFYKITDYATTHQVINEDPGNYLTGVTEPLVVLATSTSTLYHLAMSESFPSDIIYYDITGGDVRDVGYFSGSVAIPGLKGVITYREDTIQDVSCPYDFRNVKFRRWAVTPNPWVSPSSVTNQSETYEVTGVSTGDWAYLTLQFTYDSMIGPTEVTAKYKMNAGDNTNTVANQLATILSGMLPPQLTVSYLGGALFQIQSLLYEVYWTLTSSGFVSINSSTARSADLTYSRGQIVGQVDRLYVSKLNENTHDYSDYQNWIMLENITSSSFVSENKGSFLIGPNSVPVNTGSYQDYYTFGDYYNRVYDVHIEPNSLDVLINYGYTVTVTRLSNNIFKTIDDSSTCRNNRLKAMSFSNSFFGDYNYHNEFVEETYYNTFLGQTTDNKVDNFFQFNFTSRAFYYNTIKDSNYYNLINSDFYYNFIGEGFGYNMIGEYFANNSIGQNFYYNTTSQGFQYNKIEQNVAYNYFRGQVTFSKFDNNIYNNLFGGDIYQCNLGQSIYFNFCLDLTKNTILGEFFSNILHAKNHSNVFEFGINSNVFKTGFYNNKVETGFYNNVIGPDTFCNIFKKNFAGNYVYGAISCIFGEDIQNNFIPSVFANNKVGRAFSDYDFTTATHVYQNYFCDLVTMYSVSLGTKNMLIYYDADSSLPVIVEVTA